METEAEVQRHVERCVEELCAASADFASSNTKRKFAFVRDPKEGHVIETLRSFLGVFQAHGQFQRCKDKSSATLRFTTPDLVHFQVGVFSLVAPCMSNNFTILIPNRRKSTGCVRSRMPRRSRFCSACTWM